MCIAEGWKNDEIYFQCMQSPFWQTDSEREAQAMALLGEYSTKLPSSCITSLSGFGSRWNHCHCVPVDQTYDLSFL